MTKVRSLLISSQAFGIGAVGGPEVLFRVTLLGIALWVGNGSTVEAAVVSHGRQVHVAQIYSYPTYGGGDVVFTTDDPTTGCEAGFWLRPTDPGFKSTLALVTTAYFARVPVRVWAQDDSL